MLDGRWPGSLSVARGEQRNGASFPVRTTLRECARYQQTCNVFLEIFHLYETS